MSAFQGFAGQSHSFADRLLRNRPMPLTAVTSDERLPGSRPTSILRQHT